MCNVVLWPHQEFLNKAPILTISVVQDLVLCDPSNSLISQNFHQVVECYKNDDYHLPEDDNHHSHRRGNLKSYML
jgi:hypothetical protein